MVFHYSRCTCIAPDPIGWLHVMHLSIRSSRHIIFELLNKVVGISFVKVHDVNPHQHSTLQGHETIKHRPRPTGALCNIGYPSDTQLKLKSGEISFVHNIRFNCTVVLNFAPSRALYKGQWRGALMLSLWRHFNGFNGPSRHCYGPSLLAQVCITNNIHQSLTSASSCVWPVLGIKPELVSPFSTSSLESKFKK